ncbi:MAG: hypothetical protein P8X63_06510 [Desulfuromonadaceae bacterium]|jgi:hypothetical protein
MLTELPSHRNGEPPLAILSPTLLFSATERHSNQVSSMLEILARRQKQRPFFRNGKYPNGLDLIGGHAEPINWSFP